MALAESVDGSGEIGSQGTDALVVIGQQGGVEMEETLVDALRHHSVRTVETEGLALEQAGTEPDETVTYTVDGHPVRDIGHP